MKPHKIFGLLFSLAALVAVGAKDQPSQPIILSPEQAVKEGRALVDEILSRRPAENKITTGMLSIRSKKKFVQIPIEFSVQTTPTNWMSSYRGVMTNFVMQVAILHSEKEPNRYFQKSFAVGPDGAPVGTPTGGPMKGDAIQGPFVGSDFSIADLGLEFLHWPDQRLLQKEIKRSRSCRVLESINPHPTAGAYSRVKSWIDAESDGIVYAEAYDIKGNKIKEFIPKDFSKVNGQWQLEEMQISNTQTDSSTTVKFNLEQH